MCSIVTDYMSQNSSNVENKESQITATTSPEFCFGSREMAPNQKVFKLLSHKSKKKQLLVKWGAETEERFSCFARKKGVISY